MHPEFDLDLTNPKGSGIQTADPSLPSDHGEHVTDHDIEKLRSYVVGIDVLTVPGTTRQHRYLAKIRDGNKSTVIFIPGGVGWLYSIDAGNSFAGFVYPLTLFSSWPNDINLIIVDLDHDLGWDWASNPDVRSQKNKELVIAIHDIQMILQHINALTKTKIWMAGHCNSCDILARFYDFSFNRAYRKIISGLIFTSPLWKQYWRKPNKNKISYFKTPVDVPLLVVQHRHDGNKGCHPDIAKKIIKDSRSEQTDYIEVTGGVDQGLPHFSMGYHGFRGSEKDLSMAILDFIKKFH